MERQKVLFFCLFSTVFLYNSLAKCLVQYSHRVLEARVSPEAVNAPFC